MQTDAAGRAFLGREEGRKNLAYPDPASPLFQACLRNSIDPYGLVDTPPAVANYRGDPWTIGVGHTGPEVKQGLYWSDDQIDAALAADLAKWEDVLNSRVSVPLTQNQFNALISFVHNLGAGVVSTQYTWYRKLQAKDYQGCADQMPLWDMAGGNHLQSLHERRLRERELFLTPDQKETP